jgi:NadR type nicotinamide-nucleotide adenylyltransferase
MSDAARMICIIGAESTGKTTLARSLAERFSSPWVPEYLRTFCDERGRTPLQQEQQLIMEMQVANETRIARSANRAGAPYVFCDTAPMLTAIYSEYVFADTSLIERALLLHERYAFTLLLDNDIDWVADGIQRDGAHVRASIAKRIKQLLDQHGLQCANINGRNEARTNSAIDALYRHDLIGSRVRS